MGLYLGYVLHKLKNTPRLPLSWVTSLWLWAVAGAVGAAVVYGTAQYYPFSPEAQWMGAAIDQQQ